MLRPYYPDVYCGVAVEHFALHNDPCHPATQSHTPTQNSVCFTSTLEGFSKHNEYAKRGGENINKQQQ
jgi:hypothetical protein